MQPILHSSKLMMGQGETPCPISVQFQLSNKSLPPILDEWFSSYCRAAPTPFPFPLDWSRTTPFQRKVYETLQKIPFGKQLSYSDVAEIVGNRSAARAVGNACRVNPFPLIIPCHRVIASDGSLGGFAYGAEMKEKMLAFESSIL